MSPTYYPIASQDSATDRTDRWREDPLWRASYAAELLRAVVEARDEHGVVPDALVRVIGPYLRAEDAWAEKQEHAHRACVAGEDRAVVASGDDVPSRSDHQAGDRGDRGNDTTIATTHEKKSRFTFGLLYNVAKVIERHGYEDVLCGPGIVELQYHLFAFLHGTDDGRDGHCYGKALAQVQK